MQDIMQRVAQTPASRQRLTKSDFELSAGSPNQRTLIAEHKIESATFIRPDAATRLAFATVEEYQTPGDGSQTSYDLSHEIVQTPNTDNLVLFEAGSVVQPDSVDYDANTVTYTGPGSAEYLHAAYVPRDPVLIEIQRQAPKSQGNVSDIVLDEPTSLIHTQDQNQDPPEFNGAHPLDFAVPRNWRIQVYADGPVPFEWDDSQEANSQGATARNAVVSLPVNRAASSVDGLARAVRGHIIDE